MSSTMKAIAYTRYGGPEVTSVIDAPVPQPQAGEVQVRVAAAGLNPVDWHQRNGELAQIQSQTLPVIGGNEFSGTVSALGAGVTSFAVGDKVICRSSKSKWGAMGQYAVMPAAVMAKAPSSISLTDAAGIPLAGLTAEQGLDRLNVKAGDRILITGGAGGVGLFAIQLAKIRGAHVTTTASPAGKDLAVQAGADEVINYKEQKISATGVKYEKVFDVVGGEDALLNDVIPSTSKGGRIISVGGVPTPGCLDAMLPWWKKPIVNLLLRYKASKVLGAAAQHGVGYDYFFMNPDGKQLQQLADLVDAGKLRVVVDSTHAMKDYADAFRKLESGRAKGKIMITFDQES